LRKIGFADQLDELRSIEAWVLCQSGIRLLHRAAAQDVLRDFNRALGRPMDGDAGLARHEYPTPSDNSIASAIGRLERAAEIAGHALTARFLAADHYLRTGRAQAALASSGGRLPDDPRSKAIALWVRGRALAALGRKARAAASYRQALRHMPAFREARAALADLLWQFGRGAEAGEHDLAALWSPPLSLLPPLPDSAAPLDVLKLMSPRQLHRDPLQFADPSISLTEESIGGFNIAYCAGAYYGVPQSLGPVSFVDLMPRTVKPPWRRILAQCLVLPLRSPAGVAVWRVVRHLLPTGARARLRQQRREAAPIFMGGTVVEVKLQIASHLRRDRAAPAQGKA
jgi:tetratricopeptide (TPR) repeat protein